MHASFRRQPDARTPGISRRSAIAALAASILAIGSACGRSSREDRNGLGPQYREAVLNLMRGLEKDALIPIRDAANLLAQSALARGRCFLDTGEHHGGAPAEHALRFMPPFFIPLRTPEMAVTARSGDAILALAPDDIAKDAAWHGSSLIGVVGPSALDGRPAALRDTAPGALEYGKSAALLIPTGLPLGDGILDHPTEAIRQFPGAGIILPALIGAIAGEAYRRSGGFGRTGDTPANDAASWLAILIERMSGCAALDTPIADTADRIAGQLLAGGKLFAWDPTGWLDAQLLVGAGTPVFLCPLTETGCTDGTLAAGDIAIILVPAAFGSRELVAAEAAARTASSVILIGPALSDAARARIPGLIHLDNCCPEPEGVIALDSSPARYLAPGGPVNALILWTLAASVTESLRKKGAEPGFHIASWLANAAEYNRRIDETSASRTY